ncbi:MAG TPA: glycoside hydrolase domain-containing protein [Propionibacteriaceae bacterium]|nr:glycoside hydrolase domain-containing protein [Propionibacteriaceae bacterium]
MAPEEVGDVDLPDVAATMQAWTVSPFRGVGVYLGGSNRTCPQRNLNRSWVTAVSKMRWRVIPIYMGRQAPCTFRANATEFTASNAASWGTTDAANAVTEAKKLGMLPGSAIYGDMEHYLATDSGCRTAVLRYLSSWTKELHRQGYLAGVYAHLYSGAKHLSEAFGSTTYARPDAIARWDNNTALTGWLGVSNAHWANHQRAKQYRGDHNETHGGVLINIDSDRFDAPVATVAYAYQATATVNARRGPKLANSVARTYSAGATLQILCQTPGSTVGSTSVWNKLTDGTYVTDYYVSTPSNTTYSPPLPRCKYPYQVTLSSLNERLGPSASYVIKARLPAGALAWGLLPDRRVEGVCDVGVGPA